MTSLDGGCPVLELRQYTLKPGQRDTLLDLFERHFIESQEALGIAVLGHFRDRGRPDRFVWLRGFADMERRYQALDAFYNGPVWAKHGPAANETMLEFDDVRLLRPAGPGGEWGAPPAAGGSIFPQGSTVVLAGIYQLPRPAGSAVVAEFERAVAPALERAGVRLHGVFVTETAPNTFTRLPVREGEHVLVWLGTAADGGPRHDWADRLARLALDGQRASLLTLEPAARSRLGRSKD